MNLNFEQLHREFLTGRNGPSGWHFTPANSTRPGADYYVASHQIFSNNALNVSLLIRNTMDGKGIVTGASPLLALALSSKVDGKYPLSKDPNKIVFPVSLDQAIEMYAFLCGDAEGLSIEAVRPGIPPKLLNGYQATHSGVFRFILKAHTTEPDNGYQQVDIALTAEHVFHLQAFMLALGALVYPWMSLEMISQLYLSAAGQGAIKAPRSEQQAPRLAKPNDPSAGQPNVTGQDEHVVQAPNDEKDIERVSKAVFGVGINKWPAKRRDVIRYIQETASVEQMDRLIKAGNRGDFTEWNNIASLMD